MTYKKHKINKKMKTKKLKQFRKTKKHYKKGGGIIENHEKCQRLWDDDPKKINNRRLGSIPAPQLKNGLIDCNVYAYKYNNEWYMMKNNREKTKCHKKSAGLFNKGQGKREKCPDQRINPMKPLYIKNAEHKKKESEERKILSKKQSLAATNIQKHRRRMIAKKIANTRKLKSLPLNETSNLKKLSQNSSIQRLSSNSKKSSQNSSIQRMSSNSKKSSQNSSIQRMSSNSSESTNDLGRQMDSPSIIRANNLVLGNNINPIRLFRLRNKN
jgi:hypothetical protein